MGFELPGVEDPINVKGIILCGTCDLPAKALFSNMKKYNGKFGCQKCKIPGRRVEGVQVHPYKRNLLLRTEAETLAHAEAADINNRPVYGVEGSSIIFRLMYMWIKTTGIDAMHCIFMCLRRVNSLLRYI